MFDSYKILEKYPELKELGPIIQENVGRALQELLKRTILSVLRIETRAETVYFHGNYLEEEYNCGKFLSECACVLRRIEDHPATLRMNYEELPRHIKKDFEAKADYLLKKMKEYNWDCVDIHNFLGELFIVYSPGNSPVICPIIYIKKLISSK